MNIGGAETMVKDYALLTDKSRFSVQVISIDKSYHSANEKALQEAGIKLTFLSEMRYTQERHLNPVQKIRRSLCRYIDLRRIIRREQPDVLHVHLGFDRYLRFLPLDKEKTRLFYTVHNVPETYFDPTGRDRKKHLAYQEILRLLKEQDLTLIALHDEMRRELCQLFHTDRVVTVNNGVQLDRFRPNLYDKEAVRRTLEIPKDAWVIGHIGRFHEQKNHDLILDVFRQVLKERENSYLLLVGEGPLKKSFQEKIRQWKIEDKVILLENRGDIPQLMAAMDVFFFPSRWEGFGNVMIEAQSMGLPCIISDKVPDKVKLTGLVTTHPLDAPLSVWTESLLNPKGSLTEPNRLDEYDIRNSVRKLENLYSEHR
jgi:glycosyltransferase involved in cell wall biosynthesis